MGGLGGVESKDNEDVSVVSPGGTPSAEFIQQTTRTNIRKSHGTDTGARTSSSQRFYYNPKTKTYSTVKIQGQQSVSKAQAQRLQGELRSGAEREASERKTELVTNKRLEQKLEAERVETQRVETKQIQQRRMHQQPQFIKQDDISISAFQRPTFIEKEPEPERIFKPFIHEGISKIFTAPKAQVKLLKTQGKKVGGVVAGNLTQKDIDVVVSTGKLEFKKLDLDTKIKKGSKKVKTFAKERVFAEDLPVRLGHAKDVFVRQLEPKTLKRIFKADRTFTEKPTEKEMKFVIQLEGQRKGYKPFYEQEQFAGWTKDIDKKQKVSGIEVSRTDIPPLTMKEQEEIFGKVEKAKKERSLFGKAGLKFEDLNKRTSDIIYKPPKEIISLFKSYDPLPEIKDLSKAIKITSGKGFEKLETFKEKKVYPKERIAYEKTTGLILTEKGRGKAEDLVLDTGKFIKGTGLGVKKVLYEKPLTAATVLATSYVGGFGLTALAEGGILKTKSLVKGGKLATSIWTGSVGVETMLAPTPIEKGKVIGKEVAFAGLFVAGGYKGVETFFKVKTKRTPAYITSYGKVDVFKEQLGGSKTQTKAFQQIRTKVGQHEFDIEALYRGSGIQQGQIQLTKGESGFRFKPKGKDFFKESNIFTKSIAISRAKDKTFKGMRLSFESFGKPTITHFAGEVRPTTKVIKQGIELEVPKKSIISYFKAGESVGVQTLVSGKTIKGIEQFTGMTKTETLGSFKSMFGDYPNIPFKTKYGPSIKKLDPFEYARKLRKEGKLSGPFLGSPEEMKITPGKDVVGFIMHPSKKYPFAHIVISENLPRTKLVAAIKAKKKGFSFKEILTEPLITQTRKQTLAHELLHFKHPTKSEKEILNLERITKTFKVAEGKKFIVPRKRKVGKIVEFKTEQLLQQQKQTTDLKLDYHFQPKFVEKDVFKVGRKGFFEAEFGRFGFTPKSAPNIIATKKEFKSITISGMGMKSISGMDTSRRRITQPISDEIIITDQKRGLLRDVIQDQIKVTATKQRVATRIEPIIEPIRFRPTKITPFKFPSLKIPLPRYKQARFSFGYKRPLRYQPSLGAAGFLDAPIYIKKIPKFLTGLEIRGLIK